MANKPTQSKADILDFLNSLDQLHLSTSSRTSTPTSVASNLNATGHASAQQAAHNAMPSGDSIPVQQQQTATATQDPLEFLNDLTIPQRTTTNVAAPGPAPIPAGLFDGPSAGGNTGFPATVPDSSSLTGTASAANVQPTLAPSAQAVPQQQSHAPVTQNSTPTPAISSQASIQFNQTSTNTQPPMSSSIAPPNNASTVGSAPPRATTDASLPPPPTSATVSYTHPAAHAKGAPRRQYPQAPGLAPVTPVTEISPAVPSVTSMLPEVPTGQPTFVPAPVPQTELNSNAYSATESYQPGYVADYQQQQGQYGYQDVYQQQQSSYQQQDLHHQQQQQQSDSNAGGWGSWSSWGSSLLNTAKQQATSTLTKVSETAKNLDKIDVSKIGTDLLALTEKVIDTVAPLPREGEVSHVPTKTTVWCYVEHAQAEKIFRLFEEIVNVAWVRGLQVSQHVHVNFVAQEGLKKGPYQSVGEALNASQKIKQRLEHLSSSTQPMHSEHHAQVVVLPVISPLPTPQHAFLVVMSYPALNLNLHTISQSYTAQFGSSSLPTESQNTSGFVTPAQMLRDWMDAQVSRTVGCAFEDICEEVRLRKYDAISKAASAGYSATGNTTAAPSTNVQAQPMYQPSVAPQYHQANGADSSYLVNSEHVLQL